MHAEFQRQISGDPSKMDSTKPTTMTDLSQRGVMDHWLRMRKSNKTDDSTKNGDDTKGLLPSLDEPDGGKGNNKELRIQMPMREIFEDDTSDGGNKTKFSPEDYGKALPEYRDRYKEKRKSASNQGRNSNVWQFTYFYLWNFD